MINMITYALNWIQLKLVEWTINKYRVYPDTKRRLKFINKVMLKRSMLNVIRIKIKGKTCGILVTSQKKGDSTTTYIDFIWINKTNFLKKKNYIGILAETESSYYQIMYDVFMQWHENFIMLPVIYSRTHPTYPKAIKRKIAISLNVSKEQQVEAFRRILTLYGFSIDTELTLKDVDFIKPWREKEKITNVIYSHEI
jgi:hypothetical protein